MTRRNAHLDPKRVRRQARKFANLFGKRGFVAQAASGK